MSLYENYGETILRCCRTTNIYDMLVVTKEVFTMAKSTSVELGDEIAVFVSRQVESGRYGSASEVIRAGIRLLQNEETKMAALRAALLEGEQSGTPVSFDVDGFVASKKRR